MVNTDFLDALASKAPTPGGGGAAAYAGALAAALTSMVGELTVGKKRYAEVEGQVRSELRELDVTRGRLVALIDADAAAFAPLAAAYGMPRETPEEQAAKDAALQAALVDACEVPLEIMRQCVLVAESCDFMARHGSVMAVSDAGAAAVLAKAALQAASLNVVINVGSMADAERAARYADEADMLLDAGCAQADAVFAYVMERLRG
ncbi:cyclodeaminase/cyclohydrolase family protein [Adlercreutzia faecimuris]|uniref:Cyclodeaminase/cyclohydrolase family protein n=1 Tax=Adlercreutzia faecimuris TaxID=2897341 RepID=A0ABS9WGC4_9ACTN|nr:cyclodeaminase/cyclohydrolase family protein [Adlercreutzia sp. JBNU-10]MCI2241291.1 cyclodeaminase/cyclohydrolase family protein [Adlercreutzia sp. JBNU-10]